MGTGASSATSPGSASTTPLRSRWTSSSTRRRTHARPARCRSPPAAASCASTAATPRGWPGWPAPAATSRPATGACAVRTTRSSPSCAGTAASCEQLEQLRAVLTELRDAGFSGPRVAILSPYGNERCAASHLAEQPWRDRLAPLVREPGEGEEDEELGDWMAACIPSDLDAVDLRSGASKYSSIYRFKGLEAPAVVITDVDAVDSPVARSLFYVGCTRALAPAGRARRAGTSAPSSPSELRIPAGGGHRSRATGSLACGRGVYAAADPCSTFLRSRRPACQPAAHRQQVGVEAAELLDVRLVARGVLEPAVHAARVPVLDLAQRDLLVTDVLAERPRRSGRRPRRS